MFLRDAAPRAFRERRPRPSQSRAFNGHLVLRCHSPDAIGRFSGDGSGGTGALSDAAAAAPTMGRERAATARLIGGHIELIEADVMELARLAANSNAGG